jgi:hypothetical protein
MLVAPAIKAQVTVSTPRSSSPPTATSCVDNRTYNALLRALRCLGERGFALLTQRWKTLQ